MGGGSVFYERLNRLCKKHGTTISKMSRDILRLSPGAATQWKNGSLPNSSIIIEAAKYFDVSSDYLLGLSDDPHGLHQIRTDNLRYLQIYLMEQLEQKNPKAELLVSTMFKYILESHIPTNDFSLDPTFEYSKSKEEADRRYDDRLIRLGQEIFDNQVKRDPNGYKDI